MLLVVYTGVSASQQRSSKAHAIPQGLCENLTDALNNLANQQKDGYSPIQSIVTGFCERNRKGIMEGLRNIIIKVDNHRAPDVDHLNGGTRSSEVRGTKLEEEYSDMSIREGPE